MSTPTTMKGKHEPNPSLLGLICLLLVIGLANDNGKPSQKSPWLFFISIASICIYMVFLCASSDPVSDYFSVTPIAPLFFISLDLILLRKYQRPLQPLGQKPLSEMPLTDRLRWAVNLSLNPRGIGWNHEPTRHLPPRPSSTRGKFILSQLMWMLFYILQYDITNIFARRSPYFAVGGPSLSASDWLRRPVVWLFFSLAQSTMSMLHVACSIVFVATGLSEPRDWPSLFGSLLDAYTVRNCWGRVWHQMLRKVLTGHADFIAGRLRLPKSTFTTCFKLLIAFFLSGLIHEGIDYILHQKWAGHSMDFFLLQAAAIICEIVIIKLAKRAGFSSKPNGFTKFIGYIWVFVWFTHCAIPMLEASIRAGMIEGGLNFSLILGLWRGEWTPSRQIVTRFYLFD